MKRDMRWAKSLWIAVALFSPLTVAGFGETDFLAPEPVIQISTDVVAIDSVLSVTDVTLAPDSSVDSEPIACSSPDGQQLDVDTAIRFVKGCDAVDDDYFAEVCHD